MANRARVLFTEIFPQAAQGTDWSREQAKKAFTWAKHCEESYPSMISCLEDLDLALLETALETGQFTCFTRSNIASAPLLLLEEFLRNTNLSNEALTNILKGMADVFPEHRFRQLTSEAKQRKALYQETIKVVQANENSEAITQSKAMMVKQYLLRDLNMYKDRVGPLLTNSQNLELLLTIVQSSSQEEQVAGNLLASMILEQLETVIQEWLNGKSASSTINALLTSPVGLLRACFVQSETLLDLWLKVISLLASHLEQIGSGRRREWRWPEESRANHLSGFCFSYQELVRHFQCYIQENNEDTVTKQASKFLSDQQSLKQNNCLLWVDVELSLSRNLRTN